MELCEKLDGIHMCHEDAIATNKFLGKKTRMGRRIAKQMGGDVDSDSTDSSRAIAERTGMAYCAG